MATDSLTDRLSGAVAELRSIFDDIAVSAGEESSSELLEHIRLLHDAAAAAEAAQVVQMARFATHSEELDQHGHWVDTELAIGQVDEFASDALAPVLRITPGQATYRLGTAAKVAADLPATLDALAAGDLDLPRARVVVEELMLADAETCAQVEDQVFPEMAGASGRQIRHRVRRALAQIDADALAQRVRGARADRFVRVSPAGEPGLSEWWAQLSSEESAKCWSAVDELAHERKNEDPEVLIDQARADALVDLILGSATVQTTLTVAIPVEALPNDGISPHRPATGDVPPALTERERESLGIEVPGVGVIPARYITTLINTFGVTITRMLVDNRTGTVLETGAEAYRPPVRMARQVRLRDGTCRFPNCTVRAERCDLDHVIPWPRGQTRADNLIALCRHHHRLKTITGWNPELMQGETLSGVVRWTDPYGEVWETRPVDHTQLTAA